MKRENFTGRIDTPVTDHDRTHLAPVYASMAGGLEVRPEPGPAGMVRIVATSL